MRFKRKILLAGASNHLPVPKDLAVYLGFSKGTHVVIKPTEVDGKKCLIAWKDENSSEKEENPDDTQVREDSKEV